MSGATLFATETLVLLQNTAFQRYFGSIPPLLVMAPTIVLGIFALHALHSRGWFEIYAATRVRQGLVLSATLATLFAVIVVIADFSIRFPQDLNVLPPASLLFYPAIGYLVEILFHVLPLGILLVVLTPLKMKIDRLLWLSIFLTSLIEPTFQIQFEDEPLSWAGVYVWAHLFIFNLVQLYIFRRYDFVSMYAFRLVYYTHWHVLWGYLRLQWLF